MRERKQKTKRQKEELKPKRSQNANELKERDERL